MLISDPMAGLPARASLILVNDMVGELILTQETPDNKAPVAEPKPREAIYLRLTDKGSKHGHQLDPVRCRAGTQLSQ
jgi:hypothetical protein